MRSGLLCLCVVLGSAGVGLSQARAEKRSSSPQAAPAAANSKRGVSEVEKSMGDIKWGMNSSQVLRTLENRVRKAYHERFVKIVDAIEEDRLRHEMNRELRRLHQGYVTFNGSGSGWDISFLRDEFTHGNDEAMLAVSDKDGQSFYFFAKDRLWKWYKAFDTSVVAHQPFAQFIRSAEGRFGRSSEGQGSLKKGAEARQWRQWNEGATRVRAMDETKFYGFYGLVFEEKATLGRLDQIRRNTIATRRRDSHPLVDLVTNDKDNAVDTNENVVDRITGQSRAVKKGRSQSGASLGY